MIAKICFTASAFLIHQDKILLVKHKKLDRWLGPGGHIDENELPHQAAQREFLEETGLKVRIVGSFSIPESETTEKEDIFHPLPFAVNEHWVCRENFTSRQLASKNNKSFIPDKKWTKGCEKHLNFTYLAKLDGPLKIKPREGESELVRFFSLEELRDEYQSELASSIFAEVCKAFELDKSKFS